MPRQKKTKDPHAKRESTKYQNPIPSREYIMAYLEEYGDPIGYEDLLEALHLKTDDEREALRRRLIAMLRDGQLVKLRRDKFVLMTHMDLVHGRVIGFAEGHGFLVPDDGSPDLFIPPRQMRAAFDGDIVVARVARVDNRGKREASIVRVLERKHKEIVGRFFVEDSTGYVVPDNKRISQDIIIPKGEQNGAEIGQIVIAEITKYPTVHTPAIGQITEVLGGHMAPGIEIDVAIRSHNLPYAWSNEINKEMEKFPDTVSKAEWKGRKDLRDLHFVTIDGEDARDFDDAVFCRREKKHWTLYVAIADVSHYVKSSTALEEEAYNRGNSVYFPQRVLPMLPEKLSNGLCSLNPKVDRLVLVCEMNIDYNGEMTKHQFYPAVIHSHARLTYTDVAAILVDREAKICKKYDSVRPDLETLHALYKKLSEYRKEHGAISFEFAEPQVIFDKNKKIENLVPLVRNDAHRLIEQCMLSANEAAALFLQKHKWPGLFRVHPGPKKEKLPDVLTFLNELGLSLDGGLEPTPKDYMKVLDQVESRPDSHMIQTVLLRSLTQAFYGTENEGHFGLAFDAYAHFTSPIRRYPDLLVHRAIYHILKKHKPKKEEKVHWERAGEHCSMTERRADVATRDVMAWLKCEFMQDKLGETYDGIISGVSGFGFFVELADIFVEGLVHVSMLDSDYYNYDSTRHRLLGERTGKVYRLGDKIKVRVARINLDQRRIDFELLDVRKDKPKSKYKSKAKSKSRSKSKSTSKPESKSKEKPRSQRRRKKS